MLFSVGLYVFSVFLFSVSVMEWVVVSTTTSSTTVVTTSTTAAPTTTSQTTSTSTATPTGPPIFEDLLNELPSEGIDIPAFDDFDWDTFDERALQTTPPPTMSTTPAPPATFTVSQPRQLSHTEVSKLIFVRFIQRASYLWQVSLYFTTAFFDNFFHLLVPSFYSSYPISSFFRLNVGFSFCPFP